MAKRFIDNKIVRKQWFANLTSFEKASWLYLICECDAVGVYEINTLIEKAILGDNINFTTLQENSSDNIEILSDTKIFIIKYCEVQYGEGIKDVNSKSKPIQAHHRLLRKHGLFDTVVYTLCDISETLKEKEEVKVKEEEKETDIEEVFKNIKKKWQAEQG